MALRGMFENDNYMPEFGTLVVRDVPGTFDERPEDVGPLAEHATDAQPCGTIARAGQGWLEASAGDGRHVVRLEHHDSAPPVDPADWHDLVETPYGAGAGGIGLTYVTGCPMSANLTLHAGLHRVRVARARGRNRDDTWLLQFWPDTDPEPPRWLARDTPPVPAGITGWIELFGYEAGELTGIVRAAGGDEGATFDQLQAWAVAHLRPADWFDRPVFPAPPEPLPTGHADLDSAGRERRAEVMAGSERKLAELAGFAGQLGVPGPRTRRGLVDLLTAAGMLVLDASGRYRLVADPPRAWDVLDLPAERVRQLHHADAARRYARLASDLVSTVAWSRSGDGYGTARLTVAELSDRLLASPDEIRAGLDHAASRALLAVDGDALTVLPKAARSAPTSGHVQPPPPGPPWRAPEQRGPTIVLGVMLNADGAVVPRSAKARSRRSARSERYRPPLGDPPRAGVVTAGGDVIVWRDGEPVVLARWPGTGRPNAAMESAHGIVLLGHGGGSALIRPDGGVEPLGTDFIATGRLSEDGRHLAVFQARHHRDESWYSLRLIDLADNSRRAMPWDERRQIGGVIAVHGGTVYFAADGATTAWTPGAEPVSAGTGLRSIDPLSGTSLRVEDNQGVIVDRADGTRTRVAVHTRVSLAPGGTALYSFRYAPPAMTLFKVTDPQNPQVYWLPNGTDTSVRQPVWEDANTVIIAVGGSWSHDVGAPAVRLDLRTGGFEGVRLPGADALLITPLPAAER